jgi:DNA-binding NarL/FixJ family response regulator
MMNPSQPTTVLLIDANKEDRRHWSECLKNASTAYTVLEADSAETGLILSTSERIDCVVTELHLPDMSGFQVLIRLNPIVHRFLHTPVVALSHFILPSIIEAAKKLGAQSYLVKSHASGDDLDQAIQRAIAKVRIIRREVYGEHSVAPP